MQQKNSKETFFICVDSLENEVWQGRIYRFATKEEIRFDGFVEMLLLLDHFQEDLFFSMPPVSFRHFFPPSTDTVHNPPSGNVRSGKKATFLIQILFHENASWQGTVQWLEGKKRRISAANWNSFFS